MSNPNPKLLNIYSQSRDTYNSPIRGSIKARSSFAVDADDDNLNCKAREWADNKIPFKTVQNGGLKICIIDLESREEGGRAYKVVDQYGHMYDIRERVVLDIFKRMSILPGGEVSGTFRFVRDGSQNLLVPEDSEWVEKANRMADKKPVKPVPFFYYSDKREQDFYYCISGNTCLAFGYGYDRNKSNPFPYTYKTTLPKTVYLASMDYDLGPDRATGLIHALMDSDDKGRWKDQTTVIEIAKLVDRFEVYKELRLNPSMIKKPNTWSS
jgi:hypothetical protein